MLRRLLPALACALAVQAQTRITGTGKDSINAAVRGADGFIYVAGVTTSPDFPTTTEPSSRPSAEDYRPFVIKMNDRGEVLYSTLIPAPTASPASIAVNGKGEVLIAGQSVELGRVRFPVTPGAVGIAGANTGFLIKLDASGAKILVGIRGYGNGPVAYDAAGNIVVAGAAYGNSPIAPTPGAFQSSHESQACGGTGFVGIGCDYQYVAKISADGTKLLYSTFLTGTYGARPSGLLIDAEGNAIVAGTTSSRDYPVTAGSAQPEYRAMAPPPPQTSLRPSIYPPPSSGYISKLNATGTALVWSTYFSGSGADTIWGLQWAQGGDLFFTGGSASRDLPKAPALAGSCPLAINPDIPYAGRIAADGKAFIASRHVNNIAAFTDIRVSINADGFAEITNGRPPADDIESIPAYLCVADPTDNSHLFQVAPGQLITLFGNFDADTEVAIDGTSVTPLYASEKQINVQIPYEIPERGKVELRAGRNTRSIETVPVVPSAFLDLTKPAGAIATCGGLSFSPGYAAVVRNENGTLNSCENPAGQGSVITIYLNGLGRSTPEASLEWAGTGRILALEPDPDSPDGVWRMRIELAPGMRSGSLEPRIAGTRLRYSYLAVWIAP